MQTLTQFSIQVLQPQGHLNASTVFEFQNQLTAALAAPEKAPLLVDLECVESLDSAGLMALVSGLRLARSLDRRFSICSVSPAIQIIFELSQLDQVFEMFENRAAFQ